MLNLQALQTIVADPPSDLLELYSQLCGAHTYTFGDVSRVGAVHVPALTDVPVGSYVQVGKPVQDSDVILATCFVGTTVDETTTYSPRLAIYLRQAGDTTSPYVDALRTEIVGKRLGVHLAEAMGYDDYIIIRSGPGTISDIEGSSVNVRTMPLVLPPGIVYHTYDTHYVDSGDAGNVSVLAPVLEDSPADRLNAGITINGQTLRPAAWFYSTSDYRAAVMPTNTYLTDDQCWATVNDKINVMQQTRIAALADAIGDNDREIVALTAAFASVAELAGTLSVFGNSVKEVTTKYNAVTQYIPRP